jgi:hypothetical protein
VNATIPKSIFILTKGQYYIVIENRDIYNGLMSLLGWRLMHTSSNFIYLFLEILVKVCLKGCVYNIGMRHLFQYRIILCIQKLR